MDAKRFVPPILLLAVLLFPRAAHSAEAVVDLKNDGSMAVSVPLGTDNGVSGESDFEVAGPDGATAIYPAELYDKRFWSQPLSEEEYARVRIGMAVRPVSLDKVTHAKVRAAGEERRAEYRAKREAAKREAARRETEDLRQKKARLEERRDALESRIARAEKELADEEGRMEWLSASEERDIDRALQEIADLAARRDELQEQRNALSGQSPYPRNEINRLTAEIRRLNDRIATERDRIRISRDRKRSSRSAFLSVKQDWQKIVAERNEADSEIRSIDRRIRELAGGR